MYLLTCFNSSQAKHNHRDVSGLSYPVPWYQTLPNIYLNTRWFRAFFNCPEIKAITALRHSQGFTGPLPPHGSYDTKKHYLIATAPECDFKFPFIPANVTACGPMILPFPPLHTADPDLESWLKQRPTILFNLGSLYISTEEISVTIASALKIVLERLVDLQVLWKLNMVEGSREKAEEILEKQIKEGRVRIETWLKAEPNALLGSGSVVVSVHHGGANSYFEAVRLVSLSLCLEIKLYWKRNGS
jgi:UDP:flavonoid glycosyltransferase YjiC (YdhE family)